MIEKLTWRNLWRNRRRTTITMASVTFAVVLAIVMQSLQAGVFNHLQKSIISFYSGYLQVHRKGYQDEQIIENSFTASDSLMKKIAWSGVKYMVPRLELFALASNGNTTRGCMVVGTDPENEDRLTTLKSKIIQGTYFTATEHTALISEGLAKKLNLSVNDTLVLLGQGYQGTLGAGKYNIRGVVQFGQPKLNEGLVYLPLKTAQNSFNAEDILTSVALGLDDPADLEIIQKNLVANLGDPYEVLNWKQMMPDVENHMKVDTASFYVYAGILYLVIAFGLFGTVLMMIAERKVEFGMLIAIGMKKTKLGGMLIAETLLISISGAVLGMGISFPVVWYLEKKPIRFSGEFAKAYEQFGFEAIFPAILKTEIFISQSVIVLVMALLIGIYPLWHVSRLDPVTAMKK